MIHATSTRLAEAALRLRARLGGGGAALRERLVVGAAPEPAAIWVHGASVGELTSARPVIDALARDHAMLVTANSETGRDLAQGWGLPTRLAPLDLPGALGRFLDAARPRLLLTVENEFWPLRSRLAAQRGTAQAVIGARMSQRSAALWGRLPGVIAPMLGRLDLLSAQDAGSETRLAALGLPAAALRPRLDLKLLAPASLAPPSDSPARDRCLLAASTHEGEDEAILDAFAALRPAHPELRLILAIRHPQRGDAVAGLIAARGLPLARRSAGAGAVDGPLLLADTMGEMDRWYAEAGICLVGGSLADHGGHTPWEPASRRCAILHGPHVANFTESYLALDAAGAAVEVTATGLAAALQRLLADPGAARAMGRAARMVLEDRAGDPAGLVRDLRALANRPSDPDIGTRLKGPRR